MSSIFSKRSLLLAGVAFATLSFTACASSPRQKPTRRTAACCTPKKKSQASREIVNGLDDIRTEMKNRKTKTAAAPELASATSPRGEEPILETQTQSAALPAMATRTPDFSLTRPIPEAKPMPKQRRVPVLVNPEFQSGEIATDEASEVTVIPAGPLKSLKNFEANKVQLLTSKDTRVLFEIPITYNERVRKWIIYFQTEGRQSFRRWLERSTRWMPYIHDELEHAGMPQDLMYVAMIESGFSEGAVSPAAAVGMWQFIRPTANRYGMKTDWWLDERRDVYKSTRAAIHYMKDLHEMFGSWYLVAASYNMGEGGVKRLIKRHNTNDFWEIAEKTKGGLPEETKNYVPKILAAMLIAKAPALYGFRDLQYHLPHVFDYFSVPGGTDLANLATYLGVSTNYLKELNPELLHGFVPPNIMSHKIRIPKGAETTVAKYVDLKR